MGDAIERLQAALADRYTIERELGRGGNAVVYLARDVKHDRRVALKVLSPDLAHAVRAERFLREIQIAAKLTHPHILPLYDSGAAEGILYYVMPYVEGESLRDRLQRERQLPLADALQIAREVADALSYAHQHDVVHRDIKPENILLQAGHAVVADFGIARALSEAGGQSVTATGIAVGTPVYMSPEQGAGSRTLDGRSDVYSLGCVVYEMLAGQPPFTGETAQEILAHHALDRVPRLRKLRPEVPLAVDEAILTALAKEPAERFARADAFAAALAAPGALWSRVRRASRQPRVRVYTGLALGVLVVAAALGTRAVSLRAPPAAVSPQSVAVLPFLNLSADTANEYFVEGMTDELIGALSRVDGLRVPARTSSFAFKGKMDDIKKIGQQLGVANVLEGSVQRSGENVRVTVQLIKVADGYHRWSHTYDRPLRTAEDVFAVQDQIVSAIKDTLRLQFTARGRQAVASLPTTDLAAYDLYQQGRYFVNRRTTVGIKKAIGLFEAAVARDSSYAAAYSGLADGYLVAGRQALLPREQAYPRAKVAALRAVALDPNSAEAHTSLAEVHRTYDWDWQAADAEFREALRLNRQYAWAQSLYGVFLSGILARHEDAVSHARIGLQLDPLSPVTTFSLGTVLCFARRYDEAIPYLTRARDLSPDWFYPHRMLGDTRVFQHRFVEGVAEVRKSMDMGDPDIGQLAWALGQAGQVSEARKIERAIMNSTGPRRLRNLMYVYVGLGEKDSALAALEEAVDERGEFSPGMPNLAMPILDPIRSDPRFARILKKLGLESMKGLSHP